MRRGKEIIIPIIACLLLLSAAIPLAIAPSQTQDQQQPFLLTQNFQPQSTQQPSPKQVYQNATWTNKTINDTQYYQNYNITINEGLKINETGELYLRHCILNINNTRIVGEQGDILEYGIDVYGGIYINESTTITALDKSFPYYFIARQISTIQMNDSRVEYCGHELGTLPDQQGLAIKANNSWIENNTLMGCNEGLLLSGSQGSTILNNTATNCINGGFVVDHSSYNNITGNIAIYTRYGFYVSVSSNNNITDNTAVNIIVTGFELSGPSNNNNFTGNTAINCQHPYYLWGTNNDFTGSVEANWLRVNVTDVLGLPVAGADVRVENETGVYQTPYFGGSDSKTDSNGVTPLIAVPYRTFTGPETRTWNSTTVTVYYQGFFIENNPRTVNMSTGTQVLTFQVTDNADPTIEVIYPPTGVNVSAGVVWIIGTFDGTGSNVMSISINDSQFNLFDTPGPPYGVIGGFFFKALDIGIGEFDVQITVQDGAGYNETAIIHLSVEQTSPPSEEPSPLLAVFSALMMSSAQGGISPLVYAVGGFAAGAGVVAVALFYFFRRLTAG